MKKTYIRPESTSIALDPATMLAASNDSLNWSDGTTSRSINDEDDDLDDDEIG